MNDTGSDTPEQDPKPVFEENEFGKVKRTTMEGAIKGALVYAETDPEFVIGDEAKGVLLSLHKTQSHLARRSFTYASRDVTAKCPIAHLQGLIDRSVTPAFRFTNAFDALTKMFVGEYHHQYIMELVD